MGRVYVKASRRAKAYTRRESIKGFTVGGRKPMKGFPGLIRKGGRVYNRNMFSKNRVKIESHIKEQRSYGQAKWVMRGNKHGFAAYANTDRLQAQFGKK